MRKTTLFLSLITAGALFASGCDPGGATTAIGGNANGLLDDEAEAVTESAADTTADAGTMECFEPDEIPPLSVTWTDSAETAYSASVSFQVTNTTGETLAFSVALYATSLAGSAEKPVGDGTLGPGETASYSIPANELPMRSSTVVGTLSVRIRRTVSMPGGPREVMSDLADRYYLHTEGFESVRAYSEAALREERDGVIASLPTPASETAESTAADVVGDAWDGAGYADKAKGESGLFLRDKDGNVYGIITEMRFGSGPSTEPTEPSPDEGDIEETEVSDE
jgi:hypothetical protein